ncbi:hypothetical protein AcW1_003994 [Taiwanofungus camphoratus]|nr:hypothetical protein AcV7_007714 [Antrodia cinnamomea]KAI0959051.1 hypothetical protein AcW1_003994 [Antrodia cinnamomea]
MIREYLHAFASPFRLWLPQTNFFDRFSCENPILILSRLPEASVSKHSSYTYLGLLLFKCFTTAISETPAVSV